MVHADLTPSKKAPVEAKVKAAAVGVYLASAAGLFVLQAVNGDLTLLSFLPGWAQAIVAPLIPAAVGYLAGFVARHTPRPDLPPSQR